MLHHCFTQPTKRTKKTNGLADTWASRSKPKKALDLHPTTDILLQSLVFFPWRCRNRLLQPSASSGVVLRSSVKRYPADGQAIPPLRTSCYSLPPYYTPKNEYPLLAGTHHIVGLTCGPTKLTGTEGFVNLVNTLVTV